MNRTNQVASSDSRSTLGAVQVLIKNVDLSHAAPATMRMHPNR